VHIVNKELCSRAAGATNCKQDLSGREATIPGAQAVSGTTLRNCFDISHKQNNRAETEIFKTVL
jgi:hypothetical protein